jgi:hypothetical protein
MPCEKAQEQRYLAYGTRNSIRSHHPQRQKVESVNRDLLGALKGLLKAKRRLHMLQYLNVVQAFFLLGMIHVLHNGAIPTTSHLATWV